MASIQEIKKYAEITVPEKSSDEIVRRITISEDEFFLSSLNQNFNSTTNINSITTRSAAGGFALIGTNSPSKKEKIQNEFKNRTTDNENCLLDSRRKAKNLLPLSECQNNQTRLDEIYTKFALTHLSEVLNELLNYKGYTITILSEKEKIEFILNEENMLHLLGFMSESVINNGYTSASIKYLDNLGNEQPLLPGATTPLLDELNIYNSRTDSNGNLLYDQTKRKVIEKIVEILDPEKNTWKEILYKLKNYDPTSTQNNDYTELWHKICWKTTNMECILKKAVSNGINNIKLFKGTSPFNSNIEAYLIANKFKGQDIYSCIIIEHDLSNNSIYPSSNDFVSQQKIQNMIDNVYRDGNPVLGYNWTFMPSDSSKFVLCQNIRTNKIRISDSTIQTSTQLAKMPKNTKRHLKNVYASNFHNFVDDEEKSEIFDSIKNEAFEEFKKNKDNFSLEIKKLLDNAKDRNEIESKIPGLFIKYFTNSIEEEKLDKFYIMLSQSINLDSSIKKLLFLIIKNNNKELIEEIYTDKLPFIFNYSVTKVDGNYNLKLNVNVDGIDNSYEGPLDNYEEILKIINSIKNKYKSIDITNADDAIDYLYYLNISNQLNVLFENSIRELASTIFNEENEQYGFSQKNIIALKENNENIYNRLVEIGCIKETNNLFFNIQLNNSINSIKNNYLRNIAYSKATINCFNYPENANEYLISYINSLTEEQLLNNLIGNNYLDILNDLNDLDDNLTAKDIKDCYELTSEQVDIILNIQELNLYGNLLNNLNDKEKTDGLLRKINMVYANRNPLVISLNKQKVLKLENVG